MRKLPLSGHLLRHLERRPPAVFGHDIDVDVPAAVDDDLGGVDVAELRGQVQGRLAQIVQLVDVHPGAGHEGLEGVRVPCEGGDVLRPEALPVLRGDVDVGVGEQGRHDGGVARLDGHDQGGVAGG